MGSFNMKANILCVLLFISAVQGKGVCSAAAGDLCLDTLYGISATCCPPYSCTSVTSRTSVCMGSSLPAGETCFDSIVGSLGSCAQPLLCLQNVCTEPASSCIPPVKGLCYSSDIGKLLGTCCSGSMCMCIPVPGSQDYFCQSLIQIGGNCNQTEYRGFCKTGSFCVNSICEAGDQTTTSTTTTTTTTANCLATGNQCFSTSDGAKGTCCSGVGGCNVFDDPNGILCA